MAVVQQKNDWLPSRLADVAEMFTNVKAKVGGYSGTLPLTLAQTTAIVLICNEFLNVYNYVLQARSTTEGLVEWRDIILRGTPVGGAAPAPPAYPTYTAIAGSTVGIITAFRDYADIIKSAPGYTRAIGEDLMIVAVRPDALVPEEIMPQLRVKTLSGFLVNVGGSMQGFDALRVEYIRNASSTYNIAAFLTRLPGEFAIVPATPGQPEAGRIRAVFIKKNEQFGNFSPEYPVVLS
ncbi:MAG: hypothetical protein ACKVRN_16270 [Pyrinomonadaceae bacterium]